MKLSVKRQVFGGEATVGELFVNGSHFGYTLEDVVRPAGSPKVEGRTAIPEGEYKVTLTYSHHFERMMPLLNNVPGFEGVRIHTGNIATDTEGCLLVGRKWARWNDGHLDIEESKAAMDVLYKLISEAIGRGEEVTCEVGK